MSLEAFHACTRFGLGARPTDMAAAVLDPRGWVRSQLKAATVPESLKGFGGNSEVTQSFIEYFRRQKEAKAMGALSDMRKVYIEQTAGRFMAQVNSKAPLVERLVMFWSNHFTVSLAQKPVIAAMVNAYEVEAIRPHIFGNFMDMLKAVVQHPAMLFYLDNIRSFGPNSKAGKRRSKGLNENLAREILELHTLGVNGGYTQQDVIEFAKILTGWTLTREWDGTISPQFSFISRIHEPGAKTMLGVTYDSGDMQDGVRALEFLARHPATAQHIARKIARHFIADEPPQSAVDRLANKFIQSGGNLLSLTHELIDIQECWAEPLAKFTNTYEFTLAASRLLGLEPDKQQIVGSLEAMNYRVFGAASPAGFDDVADYWAAPDAVLKRVEWAKAVARRVQFRNNPLKLARDTMGVAMKPDTEFAISGAPSIEDGLALLLISPEFQRR